MAITERYRLPLVALASLAVAGLVVGAILLAGGITPPSSPSPVPASASPRPTDAGSTPESAARAFFEAFARARQTNDARLVATFVTGEESSAYLTVFGFLEGQKALGKASVITTNELLDVVVDVQGASATMTCRQVLGGYDIDATTGQPRESPTILPATQFTLVLRQLNGRWLVDSFKALL
jgi:hypothetical protein